MALKSYFGLAVLALLVTSSEAHAAKVGCTVEGGNTLCCNCPGTGSCEAAGCKWSGGLDGSCGPKEGKEFLPATRTEFELASAELSSAEANVAQAKQALALAEAKLKAAKRAKAVALQNAEAANRAPARPVIKEGGRGQE